MLHTASCTMREYFYVIKGYEKPYCRHILRILGWILCRKVQNYRGLLMLIQISANSASALWRNISVYPSAI